MYSWYTWFALTRFVPNLPAIKDHQYVWQVGKTSDAPSRKQGNKLGLELTREIRDMLPRVFAYDEHLPEVAL